MLAYSDNGSKELAGADGNVYEDVTADRERHRAKRTPDDEASPT